MSKLYKKIYNYLFVVLGIALMSCLAITFCWLGNPKSQKQAFAIEGESVGYWLDDGNFTEINLGAATEFEISTPEQFAGVCAAINKATDTAVFGGVTFYITQNLDFSAHYWVPIGLSSAENSVLAKFVARTNSNQDTIQLSGIKIDNTLSDFATKFPEISAFGLFGVVDNCVQVSQGFIKGIELVDMDIKIDLSKVSADTINVGGVAGYFAGQKESNTPGVSGAGMINCCASGTITITQSTTTDTKTVNVGGVVGNIGLNTSTGAGAMLSYTGTSIAQRFQTNAVEISVTGGANNFNIGGVVGQNNGTINAKNTTSTEIFVKNLSKIASDTGNCGGIVGLNSVNSVVENLSSGTDDTSVTNAKIAAAGDSVQEKFCAGGIAGSNKGTIKNCANYATLSTYQGALGGIAGDNANVIDNCKNMGIIGVDSTSIPASAVNIDGVNLNTTIILGGIVGKNSAATAIISLCKNNGAIGGIGQVNYLGGSFGGVIGSNCANATIKNCVNYATIGTNIYAKNAGGIAGSNSGKITSDTTLSTASEFKFTANLGDVYANSYAGGIAGEWNNEVLGMPTIEISNCYNKGKIDGRIMGDNTSASVGGILGVSRNCQSDSQIKNCINLGQIGSTNAVGTAGGIIGDSQSVFVIQNCANYGTLSAVANLGGIIGNITTAAPTFNLVMATGGLLPQSDNTNIGGIVGKIATGITIESDSLTKSIFDLGVLGYGLPSNLPDYKENKLYPLKVIGFGNTQARFSLLNSPITYYMTAPGVESTTGREYHTLAFLNSGDWYFPTQNQSTQTYYYAVPKIFQDNGIFTTDTSSAGQNAVGAPYPSQQLAKVSIENRLPIAWDAENDAEVVQSYYVNIFDGLLPESAKASVIAGEGQYVIIGQKIAKPTQSTTAIYRDSDTTASAYDEQVNALGWSGQYNFHEGYQSEFKKNQPYGEEYTFTENVLDYNLNIIIKWTPRAFEVQLYVYDYDNDEYKLQNRDGQANEFITYSLKPGNKQTISLLSTMGKTYYGWRLDGTLIRTDYENEDAWIAAWVSDSTTEFDQNQIYPSGLKLYCMSTLQKIILHLGAGEISISGTGGGISGVFDGSVTQINREVRFGIQVQLPIPTISVANYTFEGYFDINGNRKTAADAKYTHTDAATEFALVAHWTYTIKYIRYVSKIDGNEIELKTVEATYNQPISLDKQASEQNFATWNINYTMINSEIDPLGYKFSGAYSDPECQNAFDYTQDITGDLTIYIAWERLSFTLMLNANIGYDLSGNLREGGWGDGSRIITLRVPYNENLTTYLQNWKSSETEKSAVSATGFEPILKGTGYNWALRAIPMGDDFTSDALLANNADKNFMPANNTLALYIVWERQFYDIIFNANTGYFPSDSGGATTTQTRKILYEANIKNAINSFDADSLQTVKVDDYSKWVFKYWSLTPDGVEIPADTIMGTGLTVYAIYGEQRIVKFYVGGAQPGNKIGEMIVPDGAILGEMSDKMADFNKRIQEMLQDSESKQSAFDLDYWVEMTYDVAYNITESTEPFDFDTRVINENIDLLAKLKPNANYVAPSKDTTNYIIIAGIVIVASLVLLFVVLVARPAKASLSTDKKAKNKEIQAQLDEIKELERRRRNMDNPYD